MPGECQSSLPVPGSIVQYQDTFLGKASIESLSHNPSPEENAAHAKNLVATGRQYWKTRGNQGEAIWPPHVEMALLEGLKRYQKDTWKPIRDQRCPMRNKFISKHIEKTTGVFRTPRQISSRIQHLRDTCQVQSIVDLISPSKSEVTAISPSQTPRHATRSRQAGNPYPRVTMSPRTSPHSPSPCVATPLPLENNDSPPDPENRIAEPVPLRPPALPPILTSQALTYLLPAGSSSQLTTRSETPQSSTWDSHSMGPQNATEPYSATLQRSSPIRRSFGSFNVDVLLDNTTPSVPLIPLAALRNLEPLQISLSSHKKAQVDDSLSLDTVVQLVSPCPLLSRTVLSVFVSGYPSSIYTETTTLLCNSVPICGTDWFYMVSLLPDFWNTLSDAADPEDYIIEQTIEPEPLRHEVEIPKNRFDDGNETNDKPSKFTIRYRFRSIKPSLTSLHIGAQNPSVWHGKCSPRSNFVLSPFPSLVNHQYSAFHQNCVTFNRLDDEPHDDSYSQGVFVHFWQLPC